MEDEGFSLTPKGYKFLEAMKKDPKQLLLDRIARRQDFGYDEEISKKNGLCASCGCGDLDKSDFNKELEYPLCDDCSILEDIIGMLDEE